VFDLKQISKLDDKGGIKVKASPASLLNVTMNNKNGELYSLKVSDLGEYPVLNLKKTSKIRDNRYKKSPVEKLALNRL
jgi:hypothetical protein